MPELQLAQDVLSELCRYDTRPSAASKFFAFRPQTEGFMDPRIPSCFFERGLICGYASTANFRSVLEPMGAGAYGTLNDQAARFIEIPVTPIVIIQDAGDLTKSVI